MQQLDLFGAVEEKKPQSNIEKVADGDLNIVHVKEIENETEEKQIPEEIKEEKLYAQEINKQKKIKQEEKNAEKKPKKEHVRQEPKESKRGRKSYKEMEADAENVELPDDEILFKKKYYAISEVAEWFKVNTSLLRYWENEFDILKPRKTRKGDRLFRPEDVKNLHLIYYLLRQRKFSIEGAKQYLKENKQKADAQ